LKTRGKAAQTINPRHRKGFPKINDAKDRGIKSRKQNYTWF